MYPTLLSIGDNDLPSYFTMIMVGYLLALWLFVRDGKRQGMDPDDVLDLGLWCLVWGVIGARLLHVFVDGFFMDYVHLCTDPMLVEGRDLLGRPANELQSMADQAGITFEAKARLCTESPQCLAAQETGYDVGAICNTDTGLCHPEQDCFRWAKFWAGGLTFYGGFIAATLFSLYFATRHRLGMLWAPRLDTLPRTGSAKAPLVGGLVHFFKYFRKFPEGILAVADMAAAPIALAHAFGRFGCWLAGCCFGDITNGPAGVHFPTGSLAYQLHRKEHLDALKAQYGQLGEWVSLPVHPTQLYEVGANLLIFLAIVLVIRRRKRFHGHTFGALLVLYGLARFFIEFFRADLRGELLGLSTSQLIAIPLLLLGAWILFRGLKSAPEVIDDGANPPLGRAIEDTVQRPRQVLWDDAIVAPTEGWLDALNKTLHRIKHGKRPQDPATPSATSPAPQPDVMNPDEPAGQGDSQKGSDPDTHDPKG